MSAVVKQVWWGSSKRWCWLCIGFRVRHALQKCSLAWALRKPQHFEFPFAYFWLISFFLCLLLWLFCGQLQCPYSVTLSLKSRLQRCPDLILKIKQLPLKLPVFSVSYSSTANIDSVPIFSAAVRAAGPLTLQKHTDQAALSDRIILQVILLPTCWIRLLFSSSFKKFWWFSWYYSSLHSY